MTENFKVQPEALDTLSGKLKQLDEDDLYFQERNQRGYLI